MDKRLHNIDKLFKQGIEDDGQMPSPEVWQNIDTVLDKNKVVHITRKYENLKKVALSLLILAFAIGMYALKTLYIDRKMARTDLPAQERSQRNEHVTGKKTIVPVNGIAIENQSGIKSPAPQDFPGAGSSPRENNNQASQSQHNTVEHHERPVNTLPAIRSNQETVAAPSQKNTGNTTVRPWLTGIAPQQKKTIITNRLSVANEAANKSDEIAGKPSAGFIDVIPVEREVTAEPLLNIPGNTGHLRETVLHSRSPLPLLQMATPAIPKLNKQQPSPFSATVFFSPDWASGNLKNDKREHREDDKNEIGKREQNSFSSTLGIMLNYNLGTKWMVQSGLTLSTSVITIQPKTIYARADNNGNVRFRYTCSAGYSFLNPGPGLTPALGDSINAFASKNTLQYAGIPLALNYQFEKGRFSIRPMTGISFNFLTRQKIETEIQNGNNKETESINDIQGMKSFYLNAFVGLGAGYDLTNSIAISLTPTARFAVTSINKDAPVRSYPKSIGLAAGIRFKL